ncbi:hypothetical protein FHS15_002553 [Paenibacillus castaneae]|uniref:hypothetical protein n=1 Tax=Paenibacillus castaneae TaxID=474957 RepID=UPI0011AF7F76|nr:hypothetical protein [Paenibacillus castaneae]NIK77417.1 hypothetical protein [Paenibacillus castaneae]
MDKFEEDFVDNVDEKNEANRFASGNDRLLNVNEEMGADFAVSSPVGHLERSEDRHVERAHPVETTQTTGYRLGWVALVFAVASWFVWPVLMGATAAVLGFIAYRQGSGGLGAWSMAIGIIALALNLIIVPFYYAVT